MAKKLTSSAIKGLKKPKYSKSKNKSASKLNPFKKAMGGY